MKKQNNDQFEHIFQEESLRGEITHWWLHWILYGMVLVLASVVYFVQGIEIGKYGIFLSLGNLIYNGIISYIIIKKKVVFWVRYMTVSLNIITLSAYNFFDCYFISPFASATSATLLLYPAIIFLAALRMDKKLIVWATSLSVFTLNALYFYFYNDMDKEIASQLVSVDILGQVYKSAYIVFSALLVSTVPSSIRRILKNQEKISLESYTYKIASERDSLTGIANRLYFENFLEDAILNAKNAGGKIALYYIDLDNFKPINDNYGHDVGDEVLKTVAKELIITIRTNDLAARVGGDEFVVVANGIFDNNDAEIIGNRILSVLCQEKTIQTHTVSIGASIGVSVYPDDADSVSDLIKHADEAMYTVKKSQKNNILFYGENCIT